VLLSTSPTYNTQWTATATATAASVEAAAAAAGFIDKKIESALQRREGATSVARKKRMKDKHVEMVCEWSAMWQHQPSNKSISDYRSIKNFKLS